MNKTDYGHITAELLTEAQRIETAKRPSYTIGSDDVLANFKRVAAASGMEVDQCCLVYMLKHVDSICSLVSNPDQDDPEPELGRYADLINYVKLLHAIRVEQQQQAPSNGKAKGEQHDRYSV